NSDKLVPALDINNNPASPQFQPIALDNTVQVTAWATVGLNIRSNMDGIWTCPNRPTLPAYNPTFNQWGIGYQYYGGVTKWINDLGTWNAASPVKTSTAKPGWMLAADLVIKLNGTAWTDPTAVPPSGFVNLPAHRGAGGLPDGSNELFVDGSARWFKARDLRYIHGWNGGARELYFAQDDLGDLEIRRASL